MQNCIEESKHHYHKNESSQSACFLPKEMQVPSLRRRFTELGGGSDHAFAYHLLLIRSELTLRVAGRTAGPTFLRGKRGN